MRNPSRLRDSTTTTTTTTSSSSSSVHRDGTFQGNNNTVNLRIGDSCYAIGEEIALFAEAFSNNAQSEELFGESGLLSKYYSIGRRRLAEIQAANPHETALLSDWTLECRTWDLIQRLYLERTKDQQLDHNIDLDLCSNRALEQFFYDVDTDAAESKTVLDWLRDGSQASSFDQVRGNRWFYTKEHIQGRRRLGILSQSDQVISMLDPDAPIRQEKRLAEQDAEHDRAVVRSMFSFLRAGEFDHAVELARQSGNYWLAASLQGCVEHSTPSIDISEAAVEAEGNTNKALWRRMCFALSRQISIDIYERALYGSICGDLASVLPVCESWEDRMWASFNAMNQSKVEAFLKRHDRIAATHDFTISSAEHLTAAEVMEGLLHHEDEKIRREAQTPVRVLQSRLIADQVGLLLEDIHQQFKGLQNGERATAASNPHIVRIVTHLTLALRQLGIQLPVEASESVLQAYVELLASTHQGEAVALYASQLPAGLAIDSLARYLATIDEEDVRKLQLRSAAACGIDCKLLVLRTVELVFEEVLDALQEVHPVRSVSEPITAEEERLVRAFEWLMLNDEVQHETVVLGNTLFRRLLLCGRTSAAYSVCLRMPDTAIVPSDILHANKLKSDAEEDLRMQNAIQYLGYCTLVKGFAAYEKWKALIRDKPIEINGRRDPVGLRQWKGDLAKSKQQCDIIMKEILLGNWCEPGALGVAVDEDLYVELIALQKLYIPEVVLKLHGVYSAHDGRDVDAAMALAVLVATNLANAMSASDALRTYVSELGLLGAYLTTVSLAACDLSCDAEFKLAVKPLNRAREQCPGHANTIQ